jgi:hypothetical protein
MMGKLVVLVHNVTLWPTVVCGRSREKINECQKDGSCTATQQRMVRPSASLEECGIVGQ